MLLKCHSAAASFVRAKVATSDYGLTHSGNAIVT